ncbi:hypothetical protein QQF64_032539 [Cirrhinus molitorella]|uniref:Uncharacterized protein n=1 Tax=Cirrhinus molitorella TaxID=172907 RepID=A0ABR3N0A6_9TELE
MKLQRRARTERERYQRRRRRGMQTSGHLALHHLRSEDGFAAATSILQTLFGKRSWITRLRMLLAAVCRMIIPSVRWPPASSCPLDHTALSTAGGGTRKHASL